MDQETVLPAVTTAAEWRALSGTWLVRLPSGALVKMQRPDWRRLVASGVVERDQLLSLDERNGEPRLTFARRVAPFVVRRPMVVADRPKEAVPADVDLIVVEDIPDGDLLAVLAWALGSYKGEAMPA